MTDILDRQPYLFPLFFVAMWLAASTMIALMSGWFSLQERYPDQAESPIRRWPMASGRMGPMAHYSGCLVLAVCSSGLRIGVWRMFGPFCKNIFVPWSDLRVERVGYSTRLVFGQLGTVDAAIGQLTINTSLAAELASAAGNAWPESGADIHSPSAWQVGRPLLLQWALISVTAAVFFTFAPRFLNPRAPQLPIEVAILFPMIFFGAVTLFRFLTSLPRRPSSDVS